MMSRLNPNWLLFIGLAGLVAGVALPFLMVIGVITPTFLLSFLSYVASFGGLVAGLTGLVLYWQENRAEESEWWRR